MADQDELGDASAAKEAQQRQPQADEGEKAREVPPRGGKRQRAATFGRGCCACCCFCTWCLAFITVGPVGICCLGIFLMGNADKPFELSGTPKIISHQGMPDVHPAHSAAGYEALPAGVVWQADLQPPNGQGVVYVSQSPVGSDTSSLMTLDELLSLAVSNSATIMPEFNGGLSDGEWKDQDITNVASQLCSRSTWMQTFHLDMVDAISAGCSNAYIMCMRRRLIEIPMAGWTFEALPDQCDGEGRHWSDITWVTITRGIVGGTKPLYIYGAQSRLHLRAVAAVMLPQGAWSDNAAGMLGLGDPTSTFDLFFLISFGWFGLFGWCMFGCMMVPTFTMFQRSITRTLVLGPFFLIQLIVLVLGILLFSVDAFVIGVVTSLVLGVLAFEVMMVVMCITMRRRKKADENDPYFTL